MLLFCYGTLKSGHRNNFYLDNAELLGEADTHPDYRLFDNGAFPMLIVDKENGYTVTGEVWDVPDEDIEEIDMHEALYQRRRVRVQGFLHKSVYAYIYLLDVDQEEECYGVWG